MVASVRRSSRSRVVSLALCVAWLANLPRAAAQDADAFIKQGIALRRALKEQEALTAFRRAYELAPSPRAVAQIGLAEQALGRWADAEAHLLTALEAVSDPWIDKYRTPLE